MSTDPERLLVELLGPQAKGLIREGRESGSLWDAEVFALTPRLVTTPAKLRVEEALLALGIEVRKSAVWVSEDEKQRLLETRQRSVNDMLQRPPSISDPASHPRQRKQYEEELSDLGVALHRLQDGEFGACLYCGQLIDWDVLQLIPEKLYCNEQCEVAARTEAWKLDSAGGQAPLVARPSAREMDELHALADDLDQPGSVWFSCNISRQVWPSPERRFTPPAKRKLLHGQSDYLDSVVRLVLSHRPNGGRFSVDRQRIAVSSSGVTILQF